MKVLLVKSVTKHFPTGLLYLAAALEKEGVQVHIIDYVIGRYTPEQYKEKIREIDPDLVGINCFSFDTKPAFEIAKLTRESLPQTHITMGGPHATGLPEHALNSPDVDSVVIGEGEETLKDLVAALKRKQSLKSVRGLAYKENQRIVINPSREHIKDVDSILFPAYHLINLDAYFEFPDPHGMATRSERFMSILTSRGCPYSCTYCHNTFGKLFRPRSAENVIEEMKLLYNRYGIREFHIEDDSFNIDLERAEKILDLILERGFKISMQFPNGIRADRLNERFVSKLRKAGTFMAAIGVESASPRVLAQIKKNLDLTKIAAAAKLLAKHRILVWGYFMIGFLDETRGEMQQTMDFARSLKLHFASFSIAIPYPGTELFEQVRDRIDFDSYFSQRLTYSLPQIQLSEVPLEEMGEIKKQALKEFYTPLRIVRIAKTINSAKEFTFYWGKFKKNLLRPRFGASQKTR
jgi:radical SAM superfamily enzyme YgiQ (UPF0313 family)